ncbi:DUF47 domain-containing protein [Sediminivirga luteola]|uniref:DUF47 domain-containing protein n=1 Tax=Sediminivirga luteola TaxID=1774748 RepID=UPI001F57C29F|nr:DUF47 domain-containing protein [Sediminivirga luteola]MCI2266801.1 DUF47 domain-containing protein [Sediminivirga luteola]
MRLRRVPHDAVFYTAFAQLSAHIESAHLRLAELSGVPAEDRRDLLESLQDLCDAADESTHLVARQLRENYVTPLDREDIYLLADGLRDITHRLADIGVAMVHTRFDDLPPGAEELLGILSAQVEATTRMTSRLHVQLDQWEYADTVRALAYRARTVALRMNRPRALGRQTAPGSQVERAFAHYQLGEQFSHAAAAFAQVALVIGRIAAKES